MSVSEILKLIENVDPADIETLYEIDMRTHCYIGNREWGGWHGEPGGTTGSWGKKEDGSRRPNSYVNHSSFDNPTKSRDVLKSIRPRGWFVNIEPRLLCDKYGYESKNNTGFYAVAVRAKGETIHEGFYNMDAPLLQTEELAELHCILQAWEWQKSSTKHPDNP